MGNIYVGVIYFHIGNMVNCAKNYTEKIVFLKFVSREFDFLDIKINNSPFRYIAY